MPFVGLMLLLQIALVIHVLKTGRDTKWIWVLMMLPGIGALAYGLLEVAPDLMSTRHGRNASKRVIGKLQPNKDINDASLEYERSATVANSTRLAEECLAKERFKEASDLYRSCLTGLNETDPDILFGLAKSEYGLDNFKEVKSTLDTLIEKNPDYKNQDAHLLYAMNLQQLGETAKALEEYEVLSGYYAGPEPTYRYAMLLKEQGETEKAQSLFQSILKTAELSAKHYRTMHKQWIGLARKEII